MYVWQETIVDEFGTVRPNAFLEVRDAATLALVPIYSTEDGTNPLDNPFRARRGNAKFYAPAGRYQITAQDDDLERVWADVRLGVVAADLPDLTAAITAIVEAALLGAVDNATAVINAFPDLTFFTVLGDGTSPDIPTPWSSQRLALGEYRVAHDIGSDYHVKLTVFDASGDRVAQAMMVDQQPTFFDYRVRSVHDQASSNDARVDIEITHVLPDPDLPVPVAIVIGNAASVARTINGGLSFTQHAMPSPAETYTMTGIAFSRDQNRIVIVCSATTGGVSRMVYSDDAGKTWQNATPPALRAWRSIARSDVLNKWVAIADVSGGVAQIWTSPTGIDNWTLENTGARTTFNYSCVIWSDVTSLFIVVGNAGVFDHDGGLTSPDGSTWTVRTIDDGGWGHVTEVREFSNAVWGFGISSSTINATSDGATWIGGEQIFQGKNGLDGSGGSYFMARASSNAIWSTSGDPLEEATNADPSPWALIDLGAIYDDVHVSQVFGGKIFALKNTTTSVRVSSDGGASYAAAVSYGIANCTRIKSDLLVDN